MDKQEGWKIYLKNLLACPVHVMNGVNQGLQEIQRRVTELDYKLFKLHGCSIDSKETLLHVIAKEMMFPDYFGNNWDALDECMRDLTEWLPANGYVVLFEDAHLFCKSAPNDFLTFIDIVAGIADEWSHGKMPFFLILMGDGSLQTFNYGYLEKRICFHPRQSTING
jgi:RNAse (barnase) inhibitor barstar